MKPYKPVTHLVACDRHGVPTEVVVFEAMKPRRRVRAA
jgi:hypothetical protein